MNRQPSLLTIAFNWQPSLQIKDNHTPDHLTFKIILVDLYGIRNMQVSKLPCYTATVITVGHQFIGRRVAKGGLW